MSTTTTRYRIRWMMGTTYVLIPEDARLPDCATQDELAAAVADVGGHMLSRKWEADALDEALEIAREHGYISIVDELGHGHATFGATVFGVPLTAAGKPAR